MTYAVITEIAKALGKHRTSVNRRAIKDAWPFYEEMVNGGLEKRFSLDTLPKDIQAAVFALRQKEALAAAQTADTLLPVVAISDLPAVRGQAIPIKVQVSPVALSDKQKKAAMAKYELVRIYTTHLANTGWKNKVKARDEFILRYQAGEWPEIKNVLGDVSWKTIEAWKITARNSGGDPLALADTRGGHLRGTTKLTSDQMTILRTFALHPNNLRISYAITWARKIMRERGIDTASDATCRRYILSLKNKDYPSWVFYREGEQALENKCGYTLDRDWEKLEVGDVLTADGHVLNFTVINPWTGKPCRPVLILWYDTRSNMPLGWELMPTENTQAIHVALRRAIITLGKLPKVAYLDNGRAFKAEHFTSTEDFDNGAITGLYARLGIETSFATPYHGQAKTVERFFGTMLEMESIMPTYTGNSIDNKPARMHRGETLHRKLWEKYGMAKAAVTMEQAYHIIAAWFDE